MSAASGSYLKKFSSAQNLTVSPQIVVVNKYSVCVYESHWQTAHSYTERWNCQEGIEAKAKRNIRTIYLSLGNKYFLFLCLCPHIWGSCSLNCTWTTAVCREHHRNHPLHKNCLTTLGRHHPTCPSVSLGAHHRIFLSSLHGAALPIATHLPWETITKRNGKMLPHLWEKAHPSGITTVPFFPLVADARAPLPKPRSPAKAANSICVC